MKKLLISTLWCSILLSCALLCSCAAQPREIPSEPQRYEAYRDDGAVVYAMPVTVADGVSNLCLTIENPGSEDIVFSSLLCISAIDQHGAPVEIADVQGLDGIISPGESLSGSLTLAREDIEGCVVSLALDYAAGRWVALNLR